MRRSVRNLAIGAAATMIAVFVAAPLVLFVSFRSRSPDSMPAKGAEPARDLDNKDAKILSNLHSLSLVEGILQKLEWGRIAFDVPSTMQYKKHHVVELLLSPTASTPELQAQLQNSADVQSAEIRISNRMEAKLTGTGFSIEKIEPEVQAVTRQVPTRWRWELVPTEHGTRVLHLALYAHINIAGSDTPYVLRTFDKPIEVNITIPQRVSGFVLQNWQWLWATFLVPVAGYLWKRRKRGNRPPSRSHDLDPLPIQRG